MMEWRPASSLVAKNLTLGCVLAPVIFNLFWLQSRWSMGCPLMEAYHSNIVLMGVFLISGGSKHILKSQLTLCMQMMPLYQVTRPQTSRRIWILWHMLITERVWLSTLRRLRFFLQSNIHLRPHSCRSQYTATFSTQPSSSPTLAVYFHLIPIWPTRSNSVLNSRHQLLVDWPIACSSTAT